MIDLLKSYDGPTATDDVSAGWNSLFMTVSCFSVYSTIDLGPVVQNFVSLTLSLSPQPVNYISTSKANTLLFFVEKM